MAEDPLAYELAVALEKAVWLYCLRFMNSSSANWLADMRRELRGEGGMTGLRQCVESLARAKRRFPELPICLAFSDVVSEAAERVT